MDSKILRSKLIFFWLAGVIIGVMFVAKKIYAGPLSMGVRIQQEFYEPMVPMTKYFRTCFATDISGKQKLGICTESKRTDVERARSSLAAVLSDRADRAPASVNRSLSRKAQTNRF